MLTEALILHMADRSDVDIAKCIDRKELSAQMMQGDESKAAWMCLLIGTSMNFCRGWKEQ